MDQAGAGAMLTGSALIGCSGFVGSNLACHADFGAQFHSRNIAKAHGKSFLQVVCAAAPGSMFEANRQPNRDLDRINGLIASLDQLEAQSFVLVSTIAVLADFAGHDEGTVSFEKETPYGKHRRLLEEFVEDRFERSLVVRLPALFGAGLKKNFLFDMLNPVPSMLPSSKVETLGDLMGEPLGQGLADFYTFDEGLGMAVLDRARLNGSPVRGQLERAVNEAGIAATAFTHPESRFQYYDLAGIWSDISRALDADVSCLHIAPHPIEAGTVFRRFNGYVMPDSSARLHVEDMRTRHAALWGHKGGYSHTQAEVLERLDCFLAGQERRG